MGIFRDRMKKLREGRDLTQQALADALSIGKSAIALYETEKRQPDPDTLRKLAAFFHCSTDYLLGLTNEPNPGTAVKLSASPTIPPDILPFVSDKDNHGLIRLIQTIKAQGHSNDVVKEWLVSLSNTIRRIRQGYSPDSGPGEGLFVQEPNEEYTGQKLQQAGKRCVRKDK